MLHSTPQRTTPTRTHYETEGRSGLDSSETPGVESTTVMSETVIQTTTMAPKIETVTPLPISYSIPINKLSEELRRPTSTPYTTYTTAPTSMGSTTRTVSPTEITSTTNTTTTTTSALDTGPSTTTAAIPTSSYTYPTKTTVAGETLTRLEPSYTTTTTTPITEFPAHVPPSAISDGPISPIQSRYTTPAMTPAHRKGRRLVVVAMDDSIASQRALQWTLNQLLHPERDHLLIVTVATYKTAGFLSQNEEKTHSREAKAQSRALRTLDYASNLIQDRAVRTDQSISYELVSMKAADNYVRDVLVDYVSDIQADLMVMGSHAGGMLRRAILGSTSTYCLQHANVPVIIVKHHGIER